MAPSFEQRLAHALFVLAGSDRRYPCDALPRLSQEIIAEMVGMTRSRVNNLLGKFKKLGLITRDGDVLRITPGLGRVSDEGCDRERRAS